VESQLSIGLKMSSIATASAEQTDKTEFRKTSAIRLTKKLEELSTQHAPSESHPAGKNIPYKKVSPVLDEARQLIKDLLNACDHTALPALEALKSSILEVHRDIKDIRTTQTNQHKLTATALRALPQTKSWANVAAADALPPSLSTTTRGSTSTAPAPLSIDKIEDREDTVRLGAPRDPESPAETQGQSATSVNTAARTSLQAAAKEKAAAVNATLKQSKIQTLNTVEVRAARILPSGDVRLSLATAREAELLRVYSQDWVKSLGPHAQLQIPTFGVILDGIAVNSINLEDQKAAILSLQTVNHRTLRAQEVTSISWLNKVKKTKLVSSLVIEFATAEAANAVIGQGNLFWEFQSRKARRYIRNSRIKQCFKCQRYGHITTQCRNSDSCGYCAKDHKTADCPSINKPQEHKCVLCKKGHVAWAFGCAERQKESTRVENIRKTAAKFWTERQPVPLTPGPSELGSSQISTQTSSSTPTPAEASKIPTPEREGHSVGGNKKRVREALETGPGNQRAKKNAKKAYREAREEAEESSQLSRAFEISQSSTHVMDTRRKRAQSLIQINDDSEDEVL